MPDSTPWLMDLHSSPADAQIPQGVCGIGGQYCTSPGCQLAYGPACHGNIWPRGHDTSDVLRPKFGQVPYGVDITSCTTPGTMALTFDDGPYHYTNELLDLLKENNVLATFYVTGVNGAKGAINNRSTENPAMLRRMLADGHQIASHSWSHENMESVSLEERHRQIVKIEIALADLFGFFPTYYRPPYTSCGADCMAELASLGYHVVCFDPSSLVVGPSASLTTANGISPRQTTILTRKIGK